MVKEEPIDLEYENALVPKTSNEISRCTLQSSIDVSCVKLESTIDDITDQHHLILNAGLNGVLLLNDYVKAEIPTISAVQIPTVSANVHYRSSLPATENWPGDYQFTVSFRPQLKTTKGVSWTYSEIKDKLYVGKDVPCPINFSTNALLPSDVYIRVFALYTAPEQITKSVERCIYHSKEELEKGLYEAQHLIRCESPTATYHTDVINGRHSVVVPYENPLAGQKHSTYLYKFTCFNSCPGGPNRRPMMLIFTLEKGNREIARRKLDVKICACPGRDRKNDEAILLEPVIPNQCTALPLKRKLNSTEFVNLSSYMEFTKNVHVPPLKKKCLPKKGDIYNLEVKGKDCYEFLFQMRKLYEICNNVGGLTPETLSAAYNLISSKSSQNQEK